MKYKNLTRYTILIFLLICFSFSFLGCKKENNPKTNYELESQYEVEQEDINQEKINEIAEKNFDDGNKIILVSTPTLYNWTLCMLDSSYITNLDGYENYEDNYFLLNYENESIQKNATNTTYRKLNAFSSNYEDATLDIDDNEGEILNNINYPNVETLATVSNIDNISIVLACKNQDIETFSLSSGDDYLQEQLDLINATIQNCDLYVYSGTLDWENEIAMRIPDEKRVNLSTVIRRNLLASGEDVIELATNIIPKDNDETSLIDYSLPISCVYNPYFWMNPQISKIATQSLAKKLSLTIPSKSEDIKTNYNNFVANLEVLNSNFIEICGELKDNPSIVLDDNGFFDYLVKEYNYVSYSIPNQPDDLKDIYILSCAYLIDKDNSPAYSLLMPHEMDLETINNIASSTTNKMPVPVEIDIFNIGDENTNYLETMNKFYEDWFWSIQKAEKNVGTKKNSNKKQSSEDIEDDEYEELEEYEDYEEPYNDEYYEEYDEEQEYLDDDYEEYIEEEDDYNYEDDDYEF